MATIALTPRQRRASRSRGVLRLVLLLILLGVVLYPLAWMVGTAFKPQTEVLSTVSVLPKHFTPDNFPDGWKHFDVKFGRFFLNSTMLSVLVVFGNMASCLLSAYAFARLRFKLRGVWFALMIGTLLLPSHVLIVPQYILFKSLNLVGGPFPYLPLIIPHYLAVDAFFVFLMVQFMRGIPRELDEAAKIDGCTPFGVFRNVILPLSRPALVTTAIFSFIWTWNDFFRQLVYLSDLSKYTVPVFLFFLAFQRLLVQGINTSGLKG